MSTISLKTYELVVAYMLVVADSWMISSHTALWKPKAFGDHYIWNHLSGSRGSRPPFSA